MRISAIGILVLGGLFSSYLMASPKFVRLSYSDNPATSISIAWNTDVVTETIVKYGKSSGNYTNVATGTSFRARDALNYIHEVTITGLDSDTTYYYIVGSNSDGFSKEGTFKTGPVEDNYCSEFSFVFLGDNRPDPTFGGGENWPQILSQAAAHNPDFFINGGDLVIDGEEIDQWVKFLGWTEPAASRIPLMPTLGNHDTGPGSGDQAIYNQIFVLPRSTGNYGSNTEDFYYFTFGNAIFVALSTETFSEGSIPFERQACWLDEVLTNNPKKWKFVYYHRPSYTKNVVFDISHPPNEKKQNAALVPVFDKHHVDIVFTSHNHWYERYEPSACANNGKADSDQPCSVGANNFDKGTVFVVSGGAGAFTIPGMLCGTQRGRVKCTGNHHYILIKIKNETLIYEAYSAYPQQNEVMDSFIITKTKDNCGITPDAGAEDTSYDVVISDLYVSDTEVSDVGYDNGEQQDIEMDISTEDNSVFDISDTEIVDIGQEIIHTEDTWESDVPSLIDISKGDYENLSDVIINIDSSSSESDGSTGCSCNQIN